MLFDPIKMCCVHPSGDAFEEDPFAVIDELEKLDEEEGEGWGTINVNSLPCELGASVGSGSAPADRRQPGEELRTHEGKYKSYPVCIGARGRGAQIVDRGCTRAKNTSGWPLAMLSTGTSARSCCASVDAEERRKVEVKGWILRLTSSLSFLVNDFLTCFAFGYIHLARPLLYI